MITAAAEQQALFGGVQSGPPGLRYEPDFLGADEERQLLEVFRSLPLREADYRGYTAKRRIVSYGAGYDFDANMLRPAPPVPVVLHPLRKMVADRLAMRAEEFTHVLVTEYRPGTQLGWHRDVPDFAMVVGISLASACRMRFRPYPPRRGGAVYELELAPRSMYVLAGEVRSDWQHGIAPTPGHRYSVTLRTLASQARKMT